MVAAHKLFPHAMLAFPGGAQESVRNFLATHDIPISKVNDVPLENITDLILVDTQEPERLGPFQPLCSRPNVQIHVFDHHPEESGTLGEAFCPKTKHVKSVGATVTVMVQELQKAKVEISPSEATLLAIGLYEETGFFSYSSTTAEDLQAGAVVLQWGADLRAVADLLKSPVKPEEIELLHDLLQSSETLYLDQYKVLLVSATSEAYRGDYADVIHRLAELPEIDAVISAIAMDEKVSIIGRSRGSHVNVRRVIEEFGGGGHDSAASASVSGKTVIEVREQVRQLLLDRYRPGLQAQDVMSTPVISLRQQATVLEAERTLTQHQINVIPVVGRGGKYLGLVTRETVQKALFHQLDRHPILDLLQTETYHATGQTPFHEIQAHMIERNQRFVPILEGSKVVGVITRTDLIRALHQDLNMGAFPKQPGEALPPAKVRRNLRGKLKQDLPKDLLHILQQLGTLADTMELPMFAVGGFVRDLLLGRENFDVDLVVEGNALAFAKQAGAHLKGKVKVHNRFGTAQLLLGHGLKIDVATARTEYYEYPTALPTVKQSSLQKDLYRRDFTINALAICLNKGRFGDLIDFYGGQRDLNSKTIRVLHSLSFVEDPTRVFRAIRFEQRFGFRLGKETLSFIKTAEKMDLFHRLSSSRLLQELVILLSDEEPRNALRRLGELNLLRFIHPEFKKVKISTRLLKATEDVQDWYRLLYLKVPIDTWLVYLMAILDGLSSKAVGEILRRFKISKRQEEKLRASRFQSLPVLQQLRQRPALSLSAAGHILERYSLETVLFFLAKAPSESVKRQISAFVTTYQKTHPTLTGTDLKGLGLKPGPTFKKVLQRLRDAWIDGVVTSEKQERELARQLILEQKGKSA